MKNKKWMPLFVFGCSLLLFTGCGAEKETKEDDERENNKVEDKVQQNQEENKVQTITCTSTSEMEDGAAMEMVFEFKYSSSEKKLTGGRMDVSYLYDASSFTKQELAEAEEQFKESINASCKEYSTEGYSSCEPIFQSGKMGLRAELDMNELEKTTDGDLKTSMTLDELKTYFENEDMGMSCTIQ